MIQLVTRAIDTPMAGFSVIYGVSANDRAPVSNEGTGHLGYRPRDNAEIFAEEILAGATPAAPDDPGALYLGGPFAKVDLGQSGLATMNIVDDRKKT